MRDLISRQAAIKAVDDLPNCYNGYSDTYDKSCIIGLLEELPSAQPERKKGKWIVFSSPDEYHCGLVKCPFCSEELIAEANEYNYCPNCGADMRGEE